MEQTFGSINGTIRDQNTQEYIVGSTVHLEGAEHLTTATDENGAFEIMTPVVRYSLTVETLSYETEKLIGNLRLLGSEVAATLEGPLSEKTTFLELARRFYLKYLFELQNLPIRPDYWDFQYKVNHKIDNKTEPNLIGTSAIDNFRLVALEQSDAENECTLRANPLIDQWNYTVGASLEG